MKSETIVLLFAILIATFFITFDKAVTGYWIFEKNFYPVTTIDYPNNFEMDWYEHTHQDKPDVDKSKLVTINVYYKNRSDFEVVTLEELVTVKCKIAEQLKAEYENDRIILEKQKENFKKAKEFNSKNCQ